MRESPVANPWLAAVEPSPIGETKRTFRGVVAHHTAHCLEAALTAAVILEQHGFPPRVMSLESIDKLDHVVFVQVWMIK